MTVLVAPVSSANRSTTFPLGPQSSAGRTISPCFGSKRNVTVRPLCPWASYPCIVQRTFWGVTPLPCDRPHRDPCYATPPYHFAPAAHRRFGDLPREPTPIRTVPQSEQPSGDSPS